MAAFAQAQYLFKTRVSGAGRCIIPTSIMKVFVVLCLVFALAAVTSAGSDCYKQTRSSVKEVCAMKRNIVKFTRQGVTHCCSSQDQYPVITFRKVDGQRVAQCSCVSECLLCGQRPNRCEDGVPISKFIVD